MAGELTATTYVHELRKALRYLYVAAELRKSPLLDLFGLDAQGGTTALRSILVEAIQALRPGPDVPLRARPWRLYNTLLHLYVQQFSQEEVAAAQAISSRQLRRQESLALHLLADYLVAHHHLSDRLKEAPARAAMPARDPVSSEETAGDNWPEPDEEESSSGELGLPAYTAGTPTRADELQWLGKSLPTEAADVAELLRTALATVGPLAERLSVTIDPYRPSAPVSVAAQTQILQQALLAILTATLSAIPGGRVAVACRLAGSTVSVSIHAERRTPEPVALGADAAERIEMARQLCGLVGSSLEILPAGQGLTIRLALARTEAVAVMVIDDNADTLQLFQRYLAGTRYPFAGARDAETALSLIEEMRPQVIVMDVMLPGIDGWQLLGRLREHPRTSGVPIVVCSILPQEPLALSLGAAAFLRKPVSRVTFLALLDELVAAPSARAGD